jgi:hypothetical protein
VAGGGGGGFGRSVDAGAGGGAGSSAVTGGGATCFAARARAFGAGGLEMPGFDATRLLTGVLLVVRLAGPPSCPERAAVARGASPVDPR